MLFHFVSVMCGVLRTEGLKDTHRTREIKGLTKMKESTIVTRSFERHCYTAKDTHATKKEIKPKFL